MSSPSMLPENTLQQIPASAIQMDELIGQGSYGDVYCGRWNGRVVAIKQLHLKKLPAHLTADFENETKIMAECQCEQIVRLFGVSIDSNQYAMVMEYMEKGSLYQALHNPDFNVSWPLRWQIAEDVGKGLAYLHQKEIVHRDLKSLNILLDRNLRAKISDFGLSKVKSETGSTTTQAKAPGGTVRWRAPELFKRKAVHTKASDVYSYSMVLFEIASRKIPFSEASDEITVINWLNQGEQEDIPSDCPEAYAALIKRGWSLQPEQRPAIQEILQKISEAKPQNAILASIEKAWHFDLDSKPQAYLQGKKYELIPASDKDAQKVLQFYAHHPVPGYGLSSVKLIYNPSFNRIFSLHMGKLQERDKNPAFSPKWLLDSNPPWRKKVDELFHALAKPYVDSDCPAVRLLPMWHGTDPEILDSIFRAGYANLATTDSGFFGKGYYSTFEAEYAFRVYGKGALLLNWVAVFSPYPVVEGDNQKLAGKANFQNYDAHFIPVSPKDPHNPHEVNYLPSPPFQAHTYTELVVFESAAMLPRYLVELQPTMLKSPSVMRSSPEPPPQASKPLFMRQAATKLSPAKKGSHLSDHRKLTSSSEVSPKPATPQLLPSASFNDDLSSPLPLRKSGGTYELKYEIEVGCDVSYLAALPTGLVACTMHNSLDTQFRLHDHVISILHPITGQCFNTLKGHQDRIYALTPLPGGMLASGCRDATVKIWNPAGKLLKAVLKEGGALSSVLLVLRNGNLACGGKDKKISLWNPASRELISQLEGHGGKITALVELPNGSLASGSVDGVIKIWNLDTKAVRTLEGHKGKVTALVGLPKGILASASADKTIKLWNPISSELLRTFEGHSEAVKALLAMPNGSLCSGSLDKTIRLWNPITGAVRTLKGHGAAVISLAHLPENAFCSLSKDNKIKIWNEKGEERSTIDEKGHVAMLTTFPDGKILAGGKSLNQWDSSTGELLLSIDPINAAALAVFADGNFATATKDKIISLWDIRAKPLLHTCEGHSSSVLALTTLEDGTLVSGSADTSMIFWNPTTGKLLRTVKGHKASVSALVALPNKKLASGSQDNTIKIWNTANGELLVTLVGHTSPINALATLPHDMLASASLEEIIIWNPTTKEQLRKIDMPEVFVLVSLPEGLLAAANAEFCAIWDPVTGRCIQKLDHDGDSYSSFLSLAAFPDGTLIAGFNDNLICTWQ